MSGKTEETTTNRRRFLAGSAVASVAAVAATVGGAREAQAKIGNMKLTPIHDTLTKAEADMLTKKAHGLTEHEVLMHNWGQGSSDLSEEDVQSLEAAFMSRDKRLYGLDEHASLSPSMVNHANAGVSCCCCPASCCCASVDSKPVRTRRVIA